MHEALCVNDYYASLGEGGGSAVVWLPAGCGMSGRNRSQLAGRLPLACSACGGSWHCCLCAVWNSCSGNCCVEQRGLLKVIPFCCVLSDWKSLWVS